MVPNIVVLLLLLQIQKNGIAHGQKESLMAWIWDQVFMNIRRVSFTNNLDRKFKLTSMALMKVENTHTLFWKVLNFRVELSFTQQVFSKANPIAPREKY